MAGDAAILHGTCVAVAGRGVLIVGAAGSGKSGLALQLIAFGAQLVADDRTQLVRESARVIASCPEPIRGLIEARGVGILRLPSATAAPVALVVDMDRTDDHRLPPHRTHALLGRNVPCLHKSAHPHFPAAVLSYMTGERHE